MKSPSKSNKADALLDVVLADAPWQTLNSSLRCEALAALGVRRRKRRMRFWLGQAACAAAILLAAAWWLAPTPPNAGRAARKSGPPVLRDPKTQFISEEEMLAMFPPGSCVVAEVNGQKELVFFDAIKAREGFMAAQ
jgi:hypothetical protein